MMAAKRRGHTYGDLRDVVVAVTLDAGERGVTSFDRLLEKTALALAERDGVAPDNLAGRRGPAFALTANDADLVLEIVWDLARQGFLTFGANAAGPGLPCLRRSRFSEAALMRSPYPFHSNTGFLRALRLEAEDVSSDTLLYLREAISAFYMDCRLSACVMLSLAGQREFLRLLSEAKGSRAHGRHFSRIGDGIPIGAKIALFREAMKPLAACLPEAATDELDGNLDTIEDVIAVARNAAGAAAIARNLSRDRTYLYLQRFIPFAKQANRLRQALNAAPYPRLVQAG